MQEENNFDACKSDEKYRQELLDTTRILALSFDKIRLSLCAGAITVSVLFNDFTWYYFRR